MLYIIPTPIGNLEDITFRAVNMLKNVDVILAEDTRTSSKLLSHYNINTPLRAYHMHNEHKIVDRVVEELSMGKNFALISDAGTPAISDPGFLLVRAAIQAGEKITCLPGATAFVPALVCSGIPCNQFVFEGFLPLKKGRQTKLDSFLKETKTIVFYESTHRIIKTLNQLLERLGEDRKIVVCKEISKLHETIVRGKIKEVLSFFEHYSTKGEFVIVLEGCV